MLLGRSCRGTQQALTALVEALQDEDPDVRLKAVWVLGSWGPLARQAFPDLADTLRDPELQVAHLADLALWEIDVAAAVKACGWKRYRRADWGFSVMLPGEPKVSRKEAALAPVEVHCFTAWHKLGTENGPTCYVVAVCDHTEETVRASTEKERLQASAFWAAFGLNGKVVDEREVEQGGRKGREHTIEVKDLGVLRTRLFWSGRRLYFAQVAYKTQFLNAKAADYFLDSLRVELPVEGGVR
jgi:hypothetical protein